MDYVSIICRKGYRSCHVLLKVVYNAGRQKVWQYVVADHWKFQKRIEYCVNVINLDCDVRI